MKNHRRQTPLPLPETVNRSGREDEGGVPLLLWRVETPALDAAFGKTDAASFYARVAEKCEAWLCGSFAERLREEYRASDPARRRFTWRPAIYSHLTRIAANDGGFAVERTVTLLRAGRTLCCRTFRESWSAFDGTLLASSDDRESVGRAPEKHLKKSGKKVDAGAGDML